MGGAVGCIKQMTNFEMPLLLLLLLHFPFQFHFCDAISMDMLSLQ